MLLDALLQLDHPLLIASRVVGFLLQTPSQVLVRVVRLETVIQHTEPLAVAGDLLPVTLYVLKIGTEVRKATLKDLAVGRRVHGRLEVAELLPGLIRRREDEVGRALACVKEGADFLGVLLNESVVADVEDAAEAAAAELSELIDAQHLHFVARAVLAHEPLFELDHLDVFETDTGVDFASDDGSSDVHADTDGLVVIR